MEPGHCKLAFGSKLRIEYGGNGISCPQMSEDSSKEWMFHNTVEILHTKDWDRSDVAEDRRMLAESLKEAFTDFG
jgi:hypothetical protein